MSNAVYPKAKEKFLSGSINLSSDTIKVALIDLADYTYSASHEFLSSMSAAIVGTPATLGSKTVTNGVFDAADSVISAVTGDPTEALGIYKDTGDAATSPLIAFIDTGTGMSFTPNGGDCNITWNGSGIFAI